MNIDIQDSNILDSMSGDPRKKIHQARESSRDRSRSQIATFTNDLSV